MKAGPTQDDLSFSAVYLQELISRVTFASFRDENINIPFGKKKQISTHNRLDKVILHIVPM